MAYTCIPDDDIRWFESRWLGPAPYTLMFHARYVAYTLFGGVIAIIAAFYWVTPSEWGDPTSEIICAASISTGLMALVDHDKPLDAVLWTIWLAFTNPRPIRGKLVRVRHRLTGNFKHSNRQGTAHAQKEPL